MTDAWTPHQAAVSAAKASVGIVQERISAVTEAVEEARGMISHATGHNPVESAQNAMGAIAQILELTREAFGLTETAVAELDRYGGGF